MKSIKIDRNRIDDIDERTYEKPFTLSDGIRSYDWRLLDLLVATGQTELIKLILSRNEGLVNLSDKFGRNASYIAILFEQEECLEILKEHNVQFLCYNWIFGYSQLPNQIGAVTKDDLDDAMQRIWDKQALTLCAQGKITLFKLNTLEKFKRLNTFKCSNLSVFEHIPTGFDNYFAGSFQKIFDKFGDSTDDILTTLVPIDPKTRDGEFEYRLFGEYIKPGLNCFKFSELKSRLHS